MRRAEPAVQMVGRQTYRGGWPLGFITAPCPAEAPVGCQWLESYNLNCCPSGQFCFGTRQPYCCPTDDDCGPAVKNVPVCANSSWNMYHIQQINYEDYFCCPDGYIGVLPVSGASGICELEGVDVPKSQLATLASQVGSAASVGPGSGSPSSGAPTAVPTGGAGSPTLTGGGPGGGPQPTGPAPSSAPGEGGTADSVSGSGVSTGAIAGIAVGAVAVLVLAFGLIMWWHRRSLRKRPPPPPEAMAVPAGYYQQHHRQPQQHHQQHYQTPGVEQTPPEYSRPVEEPKQPVFAQTTSSPASGYTYVAPQGAYEVQANSRVEMEAPTDGGVGYNADRRLS